MGAPQVGVQVTSHGRGQGSRSLCTGPRAEEQGLSGEEFRRIWGTAKGSGRVSHVHAVQKQNGLKRFDGTVDMTILREPRGLSLAPGQLGREVMQGLRVASWPLCREADTASKPPRLRAGLDTQLQGSISLV